MVLGGTFAIHLIFIVALDVLTVTNPIEPSKPTPRVVLVDVQPPILRPPPPPPPEVQARVEPPKDTTPKPRTRTIREPAIRQPPPPKAEPPPPTNEVSGGAPTVAMPDIAPSATGVPVAVGKRNTGKIGRGGTGTGTNTGTGSGTAETPAPVSVATIKTRALPKGDYGYIDAGKDYPAEARQLGIEGAIRVRLVVDDQGKVKSAVLLNRLGHGLDELAMARAKKIEFVPAKDTDDKPVTSVVVWTFNMTLPK
jgi:protein TonB